MSRRYLNEQSTKPDKCNGALLISSAFFFDITLPIFEIKFLTAWHVNVVCEGNTSSCLCLSSCRENILAVGYSRLGIAGQLREREAGVFSSFRPPLAVTRLISTTSLPTAVSLAISI